MTIGNGVTIYDIARRAGVSHTTVAAALRGSTQISESRVAQIQKLADEMGYHPKLAARLLRAKKTGHIGFLCTSRKDMGVSMETSFDGPLLGNFISECDSVGVEYHIEFLNVNEAPPPAIIANQLVDGVIVAGLISEELRAWLSAQNKVRWVSVAEKGPLCVLSAIDNGVFEAAQYLAALGHHRIAWAGGERRFLHGQLAYEGYLRAAREFSLDTDLPLCPAEQCVIPRPESMQFNISWARHLLSIDRPPTAVICNDMPMARCIIYVALQMGIRVPEQLSVIAVGTGTDAEKGYPLMTAIEHDFRSMMQNAVRLLQRSIASKEDVEAAPVVLTPKLVTRASTAPCSQ